MTLTHRNLLAAALLSIAMAPAAALAEETAAPAAAEVAPATPAGPGMGMMMGAGKGQGGMGMGMGGMGGGCRSGAHKGMMGGMMAQADGEKPCGKAHGGHCAHHAGGSDARLQALEKRVDMLQATLEYLMRK